MMAAPNNSAVMYSLMSASRDAEAPLSAASDQLQVCTAGLHGVCCADAPGRIKKLATINKIPAARWRSGTLMNIKNPPKCSNEFNQFTIS
jgi:hypothetical protein